MVKLGYMKVKRVKKLPEFLKRYFWDVQFSDLNKEKYPRFIIERILEYGDEKAVKWMKDNFTEKKIKQAVCKSKTLSKKSANYWQFLFNLKKQDVLCLTKSFQKKHRAIWNY